METVMGFGKIPVWVYTAKNGYAWQGMDEEGEDRPTVALLDKALAAAGNTAGAWGAMVRRPVASRRWKEWPASRLCWVLFRFHPEAGRDQRGRSCNYTAAACIPAGLPPLDFAIIFQAPEMSEVQTEGFGDLGIDLDGEEYLLHEREGEPDGDPAVPSWAESWSAPVLLEGNALQTLSRWCQRAEADRGDLKAVVLEGGRAAHATFAVYPQVAAALLAEAEYGRVKGRGGDAERTALSAWEKALEPVSALNRVLGGLQGLEDLLSACKRSQAEARAALSLAERTAREMEEAHRLADDIAKALRQFRMSADAASGKTRNRDALDGLARRIMEARRLPGGSDDVWNDLASRLETLRGRVEEIEGCLDTVREYADAANQDDMRWSGLEPRARHAADRIRALSKVHTRLVPEDVLQETTRAFEQERKAPTASQESKKWVQGKPSPTEPVRFGGGKQANGAVGGAQGEAIPRRKTSARWRRILSLVTVLAIVAGMGCWSFFVVKGGLKMRKSQREAFHSARGGEYGRALGMLEEMPQNIWFLQFKGWYAPEKLKESWRLQGAIEKLREEAVQAKDAVEGAGGMPAAEGGGAGGLPTQAGLAQIPDIPARGGDGIYQTPELFGLSRAMRLDELTELEAKCEEAKQVWENAREKFNREKVRRDNVEKLKTARGAALEAKNLHDALVQELKDIPIEKSTRKETYESFRKEAESLEMDVDFDADGNPVVPDAEGQVEAMGDAEVLRLTENCRQAEEAWKQAGLERARAAHEERYNMKTKESVERLNKLGNEQGRYRRFWKDAPDAWRPYQNARNEVEKRWLDGITFADDGWSFRDGAVKKYLDKDARKEFFEICGKMEKSCGAAADALEKAYEGTRNVWRQKMAAEKDKVLKAKQALEELEAENKTFLERYQPVAGENPESYATSKEKAEREWAKLQAEPVRSDDLPETLHAKTERYSSLAKDYEKAKAALEEAIQEMDSPKEAVPGRGEEGPASEDTQEPGAGPRPSGDESGRAEGEGSGEGKEEAE